MLSLRQALEHHPHVLRSDQHRLRRHLDRPGRAVPAHSGLRPTHQTAPWQAGRLLLLGGDGGGCGPSGRVDGEFCGDS